MKLSESKYQCSCGEIIEVVVKRVSGSGGGKHTTPDQVICPKCPGIRYVSQKTSLELRK